MDLPGDLASVRSGRLVLGASLYVGLFADGVLARLQCLPPPGSTERPLRDLREQYRLPLSKDVVDPWDTCTTVLSWMTDQLDLNGWPNLAP